MASFYDKLRCAEQQELPIVAKLEGVFDALDDAELLKALTGKVHRGCQGYQVAALWRSYLAGYILGVPTVTGLIRNLSNNPALCEACGLSQEAIPSEATYSRFIAKLTKHSVLVQRVIERGVDRLREHIPDFGRTVAVDSSDISAYSQSRKPSDHDARWGVKEDKHGQKKYWFGYKIHVVADADSELPIHVDVTPANVNDGKHMAPLLRRVAVLPQYVLADAGYDNVENYQFIHDEFGAIPIININKRNKRESVQGKLHIPHRSTEFIKASALRQYPGVDRDSTHWNVLYAKRTGIERLFSRMKEFRRLASVHHRGLPKVTLHCYLSTLTIVASAVSALYCHQALRQVA